MNSRLKRPIARQGTTTRLNPEETVESRRSTTERELPAGSAGARPSNLFQGLPEPGGAAAGEQGHDGEQRHPEAVDAVREQPARQEQPADIEPEPARRGVATGRPREPAGRTRRATGCSTCCAATSIARFARLDSEYVPALCAFFQRASRTGSQSRPPNSPYASG